MVSSRGSGTRRFQHLIRHALRRATFPHWGRLAVEDCDARSRGECAKRFLLRAVEGASPYRSWWEAPFFPLVGVGASTTRERAA